MKNNCFKAPLKKICYVKINNFVGDFSGVIYNFLLKHNLLGKYTHILCVKPTSVKFYCVKLDDINITPQTNELTILEGFKCEKTDFLSKPDCMSESEYKLVPDNCKGQLYSIYYEANPFLVKVKYQNEDSTQYNYTVFESQRVIHYYASFTTLEEIQNINFDDVVDVFIQED